MSTSKSTSSDPARGSEVQAGGSEVQKYQQVPAARRRKRRGRRHPGVVLLKPDPARRIGWRARFTDPDSGKVTKETLDASLSTSELREDWAVDKSQALAKRGLELAGGAPKATGSTLKDAIDRYYADHTRLSASTIGLYKTATDKFIEWAGGTGIKTIDELTRARLAAFKTSRSDAALNAPAAKQKKGKRKPTAKRRSPATVNVELRTVRAVLSYLIGIQVVARLSTDDLKIGLKPLEEPDEGIEILKRPQLRKLLDASLAHDSDKFKATRAEHAAGTDPTTHRYSPVAPFIAFVLLTGMRLDEALKVEWGQVDLESGEIHLTATTKTRKARDVLLEVSPALAKMLEAVNERSSEGSVFGLTRGEARAAQRRLVAEFDAPVFSWQVLRQTCGSFLTNAPGIFGAASAYRSAKQLGHSVAVAEDYYLEVVRDISPEAKSLEAAMQIEPQMALIMKAVGSRPERQRVDRSANLAM